MKKNRDYGKNYGLGECDFCGRTRELFRGPYDNLICVPCVDEFIKEQKEEERNK